MSSTRCLPFGFISLAFWGMTFGAINGRVLPAPGESQLPPEITVTIEVPLEAYEETVSVTPEGKFVFSFSAGVSVEGFITLRSPGYRTKRIHLDGYDRVPQNLLLSLGPRLPSKGPAPGGNTIVGATELKLPAEAVESLKAAAEDYKKEDFSKALQEADHAIELAPTFAEAYNSRGMVLVKLGRLAEAERDFSKAIELVPEHPSANKNLGFLYLTTKREQEAIQPFRRALQHLSGDAMLHTYLGEALYQCGKYEEAVEPLKRALELNGTLFQASYRLGYLFLELKRYPEALAAFEEFLHANRGMDPAKVEELVRQLRTAVTSSEP